MSSQATSPKRRSPTMCGFSTCAAERIKSRFAAGVIGAKLAATPTSVRGSNNWNDRSPAQEARYALRGMCERPVRRLPGCTVAGSSEVVGNEVGERFREGRPQPMQNGCPAGSAYTW